MGKVALTIVVNRFSMYVIIIYSYSTANANSSVQTPFFLNEDKTQNQQIFKFIELKRYHLKSIKNFSPDNFFDPDEPYTLSLCKNLFSIILLLYEKHIILAKRK